MRIVTCRSFVGAWDIVDYLHAVFSLLRFIVVCPDREHFEIWPAQGVALHPSEREAVKNLIKEFVSERLP